MFISPLRSISFSLIHIEALLLSTYTLSIVFLEKLVPLLLSIVSLYLWWFSLFWVCFAWNLHSYSSFYCYCLVISWYIFIHSFTFNPSESLYLNWISHWQHIVGSCYFYPLWQLACLPIILIGVFAQFTLNAIADMAELISTMFIILSYLLHLLFVSVIFPSLSAFSGLYWSFYMITIDLFS